MKERRPNDESQEGTAAALLKDEKCRERERTPQLRRKEGRRKAAIGRPRDVRISYAIRLLGGGHSRDGTKSLKRGNHELGDKSRGGEEENYTEGAPSGILRTGS